jgi:hypothetical protein
MRGEGPPHLDYFGLGNIESQLNPFTDFVVTVTDSSYFDFINVVRKDA